jgi:hypothetical protein
MRWVPTGLTEPMQRLAKAIDGQFAPRHPSNPPRVPAIAQTDLTDAHAARHPYGIAINSTTGKLVRSALTAGAFTWLNADGSAL